MAPRVLRAHWPEFYKYLCDTYPGIRTSEQLYRYFYGEPGKCVCGKPVKYVNFTQGYTKYCSCKCAAKDNQPKREQTNLKKYGTRYLLMDKEVRRRAMESIWSEKAINVRRETNLKKYGATNVFRNEKIKEKSRQTLLGKYGVDNVFKSKQVQERIVQTNLRKYGTGTPSKTDSVKQKIRQTMMSKYGADNISRSEWFKDNCLERLQAEHPDVIRYEEVGGDLQWVCRCPHPDCNQCADKEYIIDRVTYNSRKCSVIPREMCTRLNPVGKHSKDTSIERFVRNILDELGEQYETNVKLECGNVDVYIPRKKLIIECNGVRWHSDRYKKQKFHADRQAIARAHGYELIYIWEDQIVTQGENIKNLLKSKLGYFDHRIGARECRVCEITAKQSKEVLRYHLQSSCPASVHCGLYYKDKLVCVATFGKRKISGGTDMCWELIRFCCAPGWQIVGGASKLLKYFIRTYQPGSIISFSSNDISAGDLYKTLGFTVVGESMSYWVVDTKYKRHHRYTYRKSELVKKGWDKNLTEFEIEDQMGVYRIWDAGQTKWCLQIDS